MLSLFDLLTKKDLTMQEQGYLRDRLAILEAQRLPRGQGNLEMWGNLTVNSSGSAVVGEGQANRLVAWVDEHTVGISGALTTVGDLAYYASLGDTELNSDVVDENDLVTHHTGNVVVETVTVPGVVTGDLVRVSVDVWSSARSGWQAVSPMMWYWEVRRNNLGGTVLMSSDHYDGSAPYIESTDGHSFEWVEFVDDTSPTTGTYVLVLQLAGGYFGDGDAYSDRRYLKAARIASGSGPNRLPIGSEDQFLRVASGIPAWESVSVLTSVSDTASVNLTQTGAVLTADVIPGGVDHNQLMNYASNRHFLQTDITNVSTALATGLVTVTTGSGALGSTANNTSNWDTAYSWGNHASAGYLLASTAATTYLKLDGSNDPITGTISIVSTRTNQNLGVTGRVNIDGDIAPDGGAASELLIDANAYNGTGQWMGAFARMTTVAGQSGVGQLGGVATALYHRAGFTLSEWRGLETGAAYVENAGSVLTSSWGLYASFPQVSGGGSVGTAAAVYIPTQATTGITTPYSIYATNVSPSYFKGALQLVDNSVPIEAWRSGGTSTMRFTVYSDSVTNGGRIVLRGAGGSQDSPTAVLNDYGLGDVAFHGYVNGAFREMARIRTLAANTLSSTSYPGLMLFSIVNQGATSVTTSMVLHHNGYVGIGSSTAAPLGMIGVVAKAATDILSSFKGASSHSGDLSRWLDNSNNVLARVDANGGAVFNENGIATADFRVESDTEINMILLDANGNTDGQLFLGGSTNGLVVEKGADTYWIGSGAGLPYGSCWGNEINQTVSSAVQNTWYAVSDTDMSDGKLNLFTHDGSGKLTATKAGTYLVNWNVTLEVNSANKHIEGGIMVNGTAQNDGQSHYESSANMESDISGTAIISLTASQYVEVCVRTTDTGTPNILIDDANLTIVMVGS